MICMEEVSSSDILSSFLCLYIYCIFVCIQRTDRSTSLEDEMQNAEVCLSNYSYDQNIYGDTITFIGHVKRFQNPLYG